VLSNPFCMIYILLLDRSPCRCNCWLVVCGCHNVWASCGYSTI